MRQAEVLEIPEVSVAGHKSFPIKENADVIGECW
jgi:hypothetical protein